MMVESYSRSVFASNCADHRLWQNTTVSSSDNETDLAYVEDRIGASLVDVMQRCLRWLRSVLDGLAFDPFSFQEDGLAYSRSLPGRITDGSSGEGSSTRRAGGSSCGEHSIMLTEVGRGWPTLITVRNGVPSPPCHVVLRTTGTLGSKAHTGRQIRSRWPVLWPLVICQTARQRGHAMLNTGSTLPGGYDWYRMGDVDMASCSQGPISQSFVAGSILVTR